VPKNVTLVISVEAIHVITYSFGYYIWRFTVVNGADGANQALAILL